MSATEGGGGAVHVLRLCIPQGGQVGRVTRHPVRCVTEWVCPLTRLTICGSGSCLEQVVLESGTNQELKEFYKAPDMIADVESGCGALNGGDCQLHGASALPPGKEPPLPIG